MPEATRLAALIKQEFSIQATLVPGTRGIFDVHADSVLVYSKNQTGAFPEGPEVLDQLRSLA
ncbi:MAG: Rdx family protein [Candidatus Sericytochromatia bacterium]|nr:Rdx family protein [Candidatus Sericytochromatia bacterium]